MDRSRVLRLTGAVLVLIGGAVHLKLNLDDYGNADILRAFAVNAGASAVVAAYLVLRDDVLGPLAGIGLSLGTFLAFGLARRGDGLLDFREVGWNPSPDAALTVAVEVLAVAALALVALDARRSRSDLVRPTT
jgi:hypothetical protein